MAEEIRIIAIFEVLGRPAEHLVEALKSILEKLGNEQGVKIVEQKIAEPTPIEKSDLFSSFAEVEMEIRELKQLINVMFSYMPAHVDVLRPSDFVLKNFDLNTMCNEIILKLHSYDEIATKMVYERNILAKSLQEAAKMGMIRIPDLDPGKEAKENKVEEAGKNENVQNKTKKSRKKKVI